MATNVPYEGLTYSIPTVGERDWAGTLKADGLLISLGTNTLQKSGGAFTLSGDLNFGTAFHIRGIFKDPAANFATNGVLRLANNSAISWRNAGNGINLDLKVNTFDQLEFSGDMALSRSLSGASVALTVRNLESTNSASDAKIFLSVQGGNAGNPRVHYSVSGVFGWTHGIKNDDSDAFVISAGDVLGTGNVFRALATGEVQLNAGKVQVDADGTFRVSRSAGGSVVNSQIRNTEGTNGASDAKSNIVVTGGNSGNPFTHYQINGVQGWTTGIKNSDSDSFVISSGDSLGTNNVFRATVAGGLSLGKSGQVMGFFASLGAGKPTVTGSRGGNAALAGLLTGLDSLGLLTNSSTA